VLFQVALLLAGGGESCADIEHLPGGQELFGNVPSDSTVHRTFHEISRATRVHLAAAVAEVCAEIWERSTATTVTGPVYLDIDASFVEVHSENKAEAAPTYSCMASVSTRPSGSPPPVRRSPACCDPATPAPAPLPTTSVRSMRRSPSCLRASWWVIAKVTMPPLSVERSSP
jgi:hypothetical protein